MVYGTGGLAFANIEYNTSVNGLGSFYTGKKDDMRTGYTVGGGVEYAFTNNLSAKVEYLYYDLGNNNYNAALVSGAGFGPAFVASTRSGDPRQHRPRRSELPLLIAVAHR